MRKTIRSQVYPTTVYSPPDWIEMLDSCDTWEKPETPDSLEKSVRYKGHVQGLTDGQDYNSGQYLT